MKISLVKAPFPPLRDVLTYFKKASIEGFYRYWLSDLLEALDPLLFFLALKRSFLIRRAGFSVINTSLIHPLHLARSLESLFQLFPDTDFVVGFGAGDKLLAHKLGLKWGITPFIERIRLILEILEEKENSSIRRMSEISVRYAVGTQNEKVILSLPSKIQGLIVNSSSITEIKHLTSLRRFKEKYVLTPVLTNKKSLSRFNSLINLSLRSLSPNVIDELDYNVRRIVLKAKKEGSVECLSAKEQLIIGEEFGLVLESNELSSKLKMISKLGVNELLVIAPSINDLSLVKSVIESCFDESV